jgi:hypothetical protein
VRRAAAVAAGAAVLLGCATTVEDRPPADQDGTISGGVVVDESVPTTVPVEGTTTELLLEMSTEMSRLSSLIGEGGADASLARIQEVWLVARPDVEATRPELANGMGAAVDMAAAAVENTRPADADKAFSILTDLVDEYTGDN